MLLAPILQFSLICQMFSLWYFVIVKLVCLILWSLVITQRLDFTLHTSSGWYFLKQHSCYSLLNLEYFNPSTIHRATVIGSLIYFYLMHWSPTFTLILAFLGLYQIWKPEQWAERHYNDVNHCNHRLLIVTLNTVTDTKTCISLVFGMSVHTRGLIEPNLNKEAN